MTAEKTKLPYQERMDNWIIEQHSDCANFKRAKEWALANGYVLNKDVSYNGFIELRKEICIYNDPSEGNRLEIQVWADEYVGDKYHSLQQYDMEFDWENDSICKPMAYRYKMAHGLDKNTSSQDLETVLAFTVKREIILKGEFSEFLKNNPTTEWKCTDPDNFQYQRLNRGIPEFKEFNRNTFDELFNKMKTAEPKRVQDYIKSIFDDSMMWVQERIVLSTYKPDFIEKVAKTYYKDLSDLKETCGEQWELILAECIFEQENSLY